MLERIYSHLGRASVAVWWEADKGAGSAGGGKQDGGEAAAKAGDAKDAKAGTDAGEDDGKDADKGADTDDLAEIKKALADERKARKDYEKKLRDQERERERLEREQLEKDKRYEELYSKEKAEREKLAAEKAAFEFDRDTRKAFGDAGLGDLTDAALAFRGADTVDGMVDGAKALKTKFDAAVKAEVEKRLDTGDRPNTNGRTPGAGSKRAQEMTRAEKAAYIHEHGSAAWQEKIDRDYSTAGAAAKT